MGYSFRIFLIIAITQFILGCATLSPRQEGMITSEPTGASVWLYEEVTNRKIFMGTTPTNAWFKRGLLNGWFVAELSGYKSERWLLPKQGPITHHFVLQKDISKYKEEERKHEEDERRQRLEKERQRLEVEKKLIELGISKDKSLWLRYPIGFLFSGLQEVRIKDFEIYEGAIRTSVKFYLYAKEQEDVIIFDLATLTADIKDVFYLTDPFPRIKKKKWGTNILKAIEYRRLVIGMTEEQAILSVGWPNDINRSVGSWGVHEQWVYGGRYSIKYLYFENGILTSWQD